MDLETQYSKICEIYDILQGEGGGCEEQEEEEEEDKQQQQATNYGPRNSHVAQSDEPSSSSTPPKQIYRILPSVKVPRKQDRGLMSLIADKLQDRPNKGKRWKRSYDISIRDGDDDKLEDIVAHNVRVVFNPNTNAHCTVCGRYIAKNEDRCKYATLNYERRNLSNVDVCYTHIYCVQCFVILQNRLLPNTEPVCFATCVLKKGGCHRL